MRVLFASTPGVGHVQPMLPLAVALARRGHAVKWATATEAARWIEEAGIEHAEAGRGTPERMAEYLSRWPEARDLQGAERVAHMFPRLFGAVSAHHSYPALLGLARGWEPDIVVSEVAELAAPAVAAAVGVPQVTHGFGLVMPPERLALAAEFAAPLWEDAGRSPSRYGGLYDHLYIDIYPPSLQTEDLGYIGAIQRRRPESATGRVDEAMTERLTAAIEAPGAVVYLTFGTVFTEHRTFPLAVEALARLTDVTAIVTVGPRGDPDRFGPLPPHIIVERYVPQSLLLPHCAAVVSHAGSGTFLGSLSAGVPQVCLPQAADQFRNAEACQHARAGIALPDPASSEEISNAIRSVLADPLYRASARRIQAEIAAMPPVETSAEVIERLALSGRAAG